eukprot:COSAG05_NODE_1607_length_4414_cov_2.784241_8_plen_147_part_00
MCCAGQGIGLSILALLDAVIDDNVTAGETVGEYVARVVLPSCVRRYISARSAWQLNFRLSRERNDKYPMQLFAHIAWELNCWFLFLAAQCHALGRAATGRRRHEGALPSTTTAHPWRRSWPASLPTRRCAINPLPYCAHSKYPGCP